MSARVPARTCSAPALRGRARVLAALLGCAGPLVAAFQGEGRPHSQPARSLPSESAPALQRDVEYLAGPETEGRGVGSVGGRKAIEHLVARMRALGLRPPFGEGANGYLQEVRVEDRAPRLAASDARFEFAHGTTPTAVAFGSDAAPFRQSVSGSLEAGVVFAGYGIVSSEPARDDYAGLDVRGKVVLVLRGMPRQDGAESRATDRGGDARAATYGAKFAAAERAGAVAVLLCNRAEDGVELAEGRDDPTFAGRAQGETAIPAIWIKRTVAKKLLPERSLGLLERQALLDAGKPGALGPLAGVTVRLDLRLEAKRPARLTANVVGVLPGRDPVLAAEYLVVGAHHDHLGRGEVGSLGGPGAVGLVHPGADDNASGVAALLEIARRLQGENAPARSIVIAAFGAGEAGMQGSRTFLEKCPVPREKIVAMVNLDSVGRGAHRPVRIEGAGCGLGLADAFGKAARAAGIEHQIVDEVAWRTDRSDHIAFLARRIPAVWVTTGVHEQYRRPSDVPALVDFAALERIALALANAVADLGSQPRRPEFVGEGLGTRRR